MTDHAESQVIAACLINNKNFSQARRFGLSSRHFGTDVYKSLFKSMEHLGKSTPTASVIEQAAKEIPATTQMVAQIVAQFETMQMFESYMQKVLSGYGLREAERLLPLLTESIKTQDVAILQKISSQFEVLSKDVYGKRELAPLTDLKPILPQFPLDCLPYWCKEMIINISDLTQTPRCFTSVNLLASVFIAMHGKFTVCPKVGFNEPDTAYIINSMDSGEGKGTCLNPLISVFQEYQIEIRDRYFESLTIKKARLESAKINLASVKKNKYTSPGEIESAVMELTEAEEALEEGCPQVLTSDITPENLALVMNSNEERAAIVDSEAKIFINTMGLYSGKANFDIFLRSHSRERFEVNRNNQKNPILFSRPSIAMLTTPQPAVVESLAAVPMLDERGFTARFLFSFPEPIKGKVAKDHGSYVEPARIKIALRKILDVKRPSTSEFHMMRYSEEAKALAIEFEQWTYTCNDEGTFAHVQTWFNKIRGHAARLAMALFAIKNCEHPNWFKEEIDKKTVADAISLARDYFLPHACYAYKLMKMDGGKKDLAVLIKEHLESKKESTFSWASVFSAMYRKCPGMKKASFEEALTTLEGAHYVIIEYDAKGKIVSLQKTAQFQEQSTPR